MVNYVNPLAMYQGKGGQYGSGWYGWQHQNFEDQQWCAWNGAPAGGEWAPDPHHFPKREPGEREIADLPSPARGDLASPSEGSPGSRPAQPPAPPRSPYEWMKKPNYQTQPNPGKTRTKDKYRVVYSDHQRLELEKEFHYSRYITIRRKAELAVSLGLSERQVKICDEAIPDMDSLDSNKLMQIIIITVLNGSLNLAWFAMCVVLLVGLHKKQPGFIKVQVSIATIRIILSIVGLALYTGHTTNSSVFCTAEILLSTCFILLYHSYANQLKQEQLSEDPKLTKIVSNVIWKYPQNIDQLPLSEKREKY